VERAVKQNWKKILTVGSPNGRVPVSGLAGGRGEKKSIFGLPKIN
jgi:hypothetical protein